VRTDDRDCAACHQGRVFTDAAAYLARKPMIRGLDVSGVTTVCIGRPSLRGLGAFDRTGVEVVLSILGRELETTMRQAGTLSVSDIDRSYLSDHPCRRNRSSR